MATKDLFELLRKTREKEQKKPVETKITLPLDEEVVEVDEFPLEDIYYSKTCTFRVDTLIMAGVLGCLLLVISFFIGRLSVGTPTPSTTNLTKTMIPQTLPEKKLENLQKEETTNPETAKKPENSAPKKQGKYELQVLTSPTKEGADEVVQHLQKNSFPDAYVRHRGRFFQVRIAGFEKMDTQALSKIKTLSYKGRKWFDTAYYINQK